MPVDWGLAGGNNALAMFGVGAQMGQQAVDRRNEREDRNAMLAQRQQQIDQQRQQQEQQAQHQQQEQRRADFPILGKLLDTATDEPTYQQALAAAHQYGIDTSSAPPNFDPNWVGQQKMILQAVQTPQGQQALSNAGKQAQDAGFQPGTPEFTHAVRQIITVGMAQAYVGDDRATHLYTPDPFGGGGQVQGTPINPNAPPMGQNGGALAPGQVQGGPQPGTVEEGYRFRGGNPADPNAWEPVAAGGPASPAPVGFPGP